MLSLACLFLLAVFLTVCYVKNGKSKTVKSGILAVLAVLILESACYGYFLTLAYQGRSHFLIGNQTILDALIKARLTYSVYYAQGKKSYVYRADPDLGYTVAKNKDAGSYTSNQDGMRGQKEYSLVPKEGILRIAAFGDSFVFCDGEKDSDTWPAQLENLASNIEVLNFGVSGYGFGQSYLRYLKDGLKFHPDVVIFSRIEYTGRDWFDPIEAAHLNLRTAEFYRARFWLEGDQVRSDTISPFTLFDPVFRQQQVYERLGINLNLPVYKWKLFSISNLGLFVKNTMLNRAVLSKSRSEFHENPELNAAMLENLLQIARRNGSQVLFLANRARRELNPKLSQVLERYSDMAHYVYFEPLLLEAIQQRGFDREALLNSSRHYNAKGNQIFAETVLSILKTLSFKKSIA